MSPEEIILNVCLALKKKERCLIVTDEKKKDIAAKIFEKSKNLASTELIEIPIMNNNGQEPEKWVSDKMSEYDVVIIVTEKSLSWTESRVRATKNGARIASMPGITEDIINRAIDVDYKRMSTLTNKLADYLDKGEVVSIKTELGTDINFSIKGRIAYGRNVGIFSESGDWGNLPGAEAFVAPVEGTSNGVYVVDASQAGIGKLDEPIKVTVEKGFAVKFEGGREARDFERLVASVGEKGAYNISEFGIGTNPNARVSGVVLEDEKVAGTCHLALGKNSGFGGKVNVPFHVDGIFRKPTISIDDEKIMDNGKFLVDI